MADINIKHTFRDDSAGARGVGQSPGNLKPLGDSIADAIGKKLTASRLVKLAGGASGPVITKSNINRIVRQISNDLAKQISQSLLKTLSKPSVTKSGTSDKKVIDVISNLDKHIQSAINKLNTQLSKQMGVKLGTSISKDISNAITGSIEKIIPRSLGTVTKDLSKALSGIQSIVREIGTIAASIRKMRQSGGIDVGEIRPIINGLKKLGSEFKKLPSEIKQAREATKGLAKEEKELFNKILNEIKKSTKAQVAGIKRRAAEDPQKFAKAIATEISKAVKDMPALKDTRIEKTLSGLDKKVGSVADIVKAFKGVEKELKGQIRGGEISPKGLDALVKTIGVLNSSLKGLPKTVGVSEKDVEFKGLEAFIKRTERFLKTLEKFSITIDVKGLAELRKTILEQARAGIKEGLKKGVKEGLNPIIEEIVDKQAEKGITKALEKGAKKAKPIINIDLNIDKMSKDLKDSLNKVIDDISKKAKTLGFEYEIDIVTQVEKAKKSFAGGKPGEMRGALFNLREMPELKEFSDALKDAADAVAVTYSIKDVGTSSKKLVGEIDKTTNKLASARNIIEEVENRSKEFVMGPVSTAKAALESYKIYRYPEKVVPPTEAVRFDPKVKPEVKFGEPARKAVEQNISLLSKSLKDLQEYMVNTLSAELASSARGWEIVRESVEQPIKEYFELAKGGSLGNVKTAGKQWALQIANIKKMRDTLGEEFVAAAPTKVVSAYKQRLVKGEMERTKTEFQPIRIADWIKVTSDESIRALEKVGEITKRQADAFIKLKADFPAPIAGEEMAEAVEQLLGSATEVRRVFSKTYAALEAERQMVKGIGETVSPVVKRIAIPAAKLTETGAAAFETAMGAKRALPKFAVFKTGFEELYDILLKAGKIKAGEPFSGRIEEVGLTPKGDTLKIARGLAKEMMTAIRPVVGKEKFEEMYEKAAVTKGVELKRAGVIKAIPELEEQVRNAIEQFKTLPEADQSIENFIDAMNRVDVSAYDVVKSLDQLKFENVYDILKRLVGGRLKSVAEAPAWSKPIRDFENTIRDLEQLLPLVEPGRPRRATHQEAVLQLLTRMSPLYKEINVKLGEQKDLIKDVNIRLGEMVDEAKALRSVGLTEAARVPETVREISTLGIPESLAGKIEPMAKKGEFLGDINALTMKMYTENLRELAPFGEFQAWQRNIANVTNAMSSASQETVDAFKGIGKTVLTGVGTEFPTLRTERERELVAGGRYGRRGYGLNVLAELRTTAGTFEDQVIISGKIADALTSVTKTLVKPGISGRLREYGKRAAVGETDIKPHLLKDIEKPISEVSDVIQNLLGVEEKYKGRADKALIEGVARAVTVTRGADVEVQAAKIAEVFLNYFGRKIVTRYGAKGVSVTPSNLREVLEYHGEKRMEVTPRVGGTRAGVGVAVMPKTMGQLASEILSGEAEKLERAGMAPSDVKNLSTALVTSGNKFMLDMFKQAGVIAEDEISIEKRTFTRLQNALEKLDIDLASDIEGIKGLKKVYKEKIGKELYVEKPIDIRISAAGIAKRGLQPEVLESVMANIIGAGPGGVTTMKELKPEVYKKMLEGEATLEPGLLSKYTEALGFKRAEEAGGREEVYNKLKQQFEVQLLKSKMETTAAKELAARMAELEATSNYYVDVIDELGKARKGLVGPKFVQIIEEPHLYPEWESKAIEKGVKGEKLDLPAFASYAAIFGEQSEFMKEVKGAATIDTKEAWEYIKALQVVNEQNQEFRKMLMKPLETKDLMNIKDFTEASGSLEDIRGTILDIQKYPEPFKLKIPRTTKPKPGEEEEPYEELYIPAAVARGTYEEPLIAGERAPKLVARRLAHLVSMAKKVERGRTEFADVEDQITELNEQLDVTEDESKIALIKDKLTELGRKLEQLYGAPENVEAVKRKIVSTVGGMISSVQKTRSKEKVLEVIDTLMPALSETEAPAKGFWTAGTTQPLKLSEKEHIEKLKNQSDTLKNYIDTVNRIGDILIGISEGSKSHLRMMESDLASLQEEEPDPAILKKWATISKVKPEKDIVTKKLAHNIEVYRDRLKATPTVEKAAESGKLANMVRDLGITMEQTDEEYAKNLAALVKAKIAYYNTLATVALGKKGAVAEVLFSRKIPAIMGKAVTAVVDRTDELQQFTVALGEIQEEGAKLGLGPIVSELDKVSEGVSKIQIEHAERIEKYKRGLKLPVLKQHELGVPPEYAEKIPVEFEKRFEMGKGMFPAPIKRKEVKGTLKDLLKYEESLEAMVSVLETETPRTDEIKKLLGEIKEHIEKDLYAYIESVRYPFTGVSTVQPYKPKLMREEGMKHALAVPGMPEMDLEEFDRLYEKVKGVRTKLEEERSKLGEAPEDLQKRKDLSETIDKLDLAISAVIPRYIAHQQKLDFDGDTIEIHSATTAKAREDIKRHFDSLSGDIKSTQAVFRDFFTYGAAQMPTGDYPLAEMAKTFEKKFPAEKGFEFLKKPYLTKELKYLKPAEQLDILAGRPKAAPAAKILESIVSEVAKTPEEEKQALDAIKEAAEKGTVAMVAAIEKLGGSLNLLVKEGIKTRTFEEKYKDTLEAQLYKIHTGPETEQLYRMMRTVEMGTGFGAGQAGIGTVSRATESFKERWPAGKALGAEPVMEFQTMINELLRFGIQKGMDVKHAGEFPVAGEVVKELSKGEKAAEKLFERIVVEGEDAFSDLGDFALANEKAIRSRLGALSLTELKKEAVGLRRARGMEAVDIEKAVGTEGREFVTKEIVSLAGFKGFLVEIAKQIKEEAIEGIIKEVQSLPPTKKTERLRGATDIRAFATKEIEKEISGKRGQIDIGKHVIAQRQPLYMKRIFSANIAKELAALEEVRGETIDVPEFAELPKGQQKELIEKYKQAQATAINLAKDLQNATETMGGGAYAQMVSSAIENIYKEQETIQTEILDKLKEPAAFDVPRESLVERVIGGMDLNEFAKSVIGDPTKEGLELKTQMSKKFVVEMNQKVREYSKLVGLPPMTTLETFEVSELGEEFEKKAKSMFAVEGLDEEDFKNKVKEFTDVWIAKAQALSQIDKIIKVLKARKYEERLLMNILPSKKDIKEKMVKPIERLAAEQGAMSRVEREALVKRYAPKMQERKEETRRLAAEKSAIDREILPRVSKECIKVTNCDKPLLVYIAGADDGIRFDVGKENALTGALKEAMTGETRTADYFSELNKQFAYLSEMAKRATKGLNELSGATYETIYRASALKGGAGGAQVPSIMREMLKGFGGGSKRLEAEAMLGTAAHAKIERELKKKYGEQVDVEKFVEYKDASIGTVVGHIDAVFKDTTGKVESVMDIKTASSELVRKLGEGVLTLDEAMNKALKGYEKKKIQDAVSQINLYMAALSQEEGFDPKEIEGIVKFYDKYDLGKEPATVKFKFSEERLTRDIEAVRKARELIQKYIMEESPIEGMDVSYRKAISSIVQKLKGKGKEYEVTGSLEQLRNIEKINKDLKELTEGEITDFIEKATDYLKTIKGGVKRLPTEKVPWSSRKKGVEDRERVKVEKDIAESAKSRIDYKTFREPPKMAEGDLDVIYESLIRLHEQAKSYQKVQEELDFNAIFETLDDDVKALITEAREMGRGTGVGPRLVELLNRLQEQGTIDQSEQSKIWKMYRIAVGDFFIKTASDAKKLIAEADLEEDISKGTRAYEEFKANIDAFRKYIIESLGKATDIYTFKAGYGREFWTPEMAKGAEVYLPPEEITKRAAGPLGEDERLHKIFQQIVAGAGEGVTMEAPILKAREVISSLTDINKLIKDLNNIDLVIRKGKEFSDAWDFSALVGDVTRLRAALQKYLRFNVREDFVPEQRKNLEDTLSYLKQIEKMFSKIGQKRTPTEWGEMGTVKVLPWLEPKTQRALHTRNIAAVREYFKKTEEAGGPKVGERFTYMVKILGQTGNVLKNTAHDFHKYGEYVNKAIEPVAAFSEKQRDLMIYTQGANRTFRAALRRVAMWGGAATVVYGGISKLKDMIGTLADIEMGVAQLRMVMSPLETDFDRMSEGAIGFAKQYGVPMNDVLKSMRIFAQQGLKQEEVIDRTRTATIASNVSTLNAKDATEAITAASKVFRQEGASTLRYIDAWSEVEAKHAITSEDMALALRKAASAGKNAGFTFDELNGVIASIGSVTRQTGREVGTSLRFIFRRLATEKGPKELAKLQIPVLTETGELRKGYDILKDLAAVWKDLTSAQRMSIAQSIGGTRQYNQLLVLMDNWEEAVSATRDSINSKGSAERRNLEVMKTYTKQLEQTKQAAVELQMEFGKVYLPIAKVGLKGTKFLLESISGIPTAAKAAAVGIALLVSYIAKGDKLLTTLATSFGKGRTVISDFFDAFRKGAKVSVFEVFGVGKGPDLEGLKKVGQGKSMKDFHSALGKTAYLVAQAGTAYNEFIADVMTGSGKIAEKVGETTESVGKSFTMLNEEAIASYGGYKGIWALLKKQGFKGVVASLPKILGPAAMIGTEVVGKSTEYAGRAIDVFGEKLGGAGQKFLKQWASQNTGFVRATAPMIASLAVLTPALKAIYDYYGKSTKSAQDYEKSVYGIRRANESELSTIKGLIKEYDSLESRLAEVREAAKPEVKARRMELGTYESPLLALGDIQKDALDTSNKLAETNINLIAGYDKLGNAVLKTVGDFKEYLKTIEKLKIKEMAKTEINVLDKYIKDLTEIKGPEKWKSELKKLLKEAPVFGEIIGRHIKISPAKALDEVTKKLNALITLKTKYPISTAFDKDIKKYQTSLKAVRAGFSDTYGDFRRVLSEVPTAGLGREEISELLGREELRKGYELIVEVEPRFQVKGIKGKVKWEDVLGAEVLKRVFPTTAPVLDVTAAFTKARLETAGAKPRSGKALSGDIVTFFDDVTNQFDIAGNQAIVSLKKTADGVFEWVVTYFNTKTLKVEERPFTRDMQQLVENVFPQRAMEEDLSERIQTFNEFVAGAAAGLKGISAKEFKRDFTLGERFFAEIPTTTIMQGPKGFIPGAAGGEFGVSPFQKAWKDTTEEFFFKPMREYRMKVEQLQKLRLEGLEGETTIGTGLYEELNKLQEVLKNNQVVLQYRAVFVDLTKTIEQSTRAVQENLAVEKSRLELEKSVSGYMKGIPEGLENLNIGVHKFNELTAEQRALRESPTYRREAVGMRMAETRATGIKERVYAVDKALVAIESIRAVSKGFGAAMTPEDMKKYTEVVARTGETGTAELILETSKVSENTADTVGRLDRILENMGDEVAVESILSRFTDRLGAGLGGAFGGIRETLNALERVAGIREKYRDEGNQEVVIAANKALDILSNNLVQQVGLKEGMKKVEKNITFFGKDFTAEEFAQRAFGGKMDLKSFMDEMSKELPEVKGGFDWRPSRIVAARPVFEETKGVKKLLDLQKDDSKNQWISSKNIIKSTAALTAFEQFNKAGHNKVITKLEEQIKSFDAQLVEAKATGKSNEEIKNLTEEKTKVEEALGVKRAKLEFDKMVQMIAIVTAGSMSFAKALGMTEGQIKGLGAAAVAAYVSTKIASSIMGKDLPEAAKKFEEKLKETVTKTVRKGEKPGLKDLYDLKEAGKEFMRDYGNTVKEGADNFKNTVKAAGTDFSDEVKKSEGSGGAKKFASGGMIHGPGGPKDDKILIGASPGEYVINAAKTRKVGQGPLDYINKYGELPNTMGHQAGGIVQRYNKSPYEMGGPEITQPPYAMGGPKDISKILEEKYGIKLLEVRKYATGDTVDDIPIRVSDGEYIISNDKAKDVGYDKLDFINKYGELPQFQKGGPVGNVPTTSGPTRKVEVDLSANSINRLRQMLMTYVVATGAGYLAQKADEKTRLATLNKRAERQAEVFANIVEKYPEAAEKVIQKMQSKARDIEEIGRATVPTETKSLVLDTEKERKKVVSNMEKVRKDLEKEHKRITKEMEKSAEKLASIKLAEAFEMEMELMERAVRDLEIADVIDKQLREVLFRSNWKKEIGKELKFPESAGKLAGRYRPEPIDFGIRSTAEMTPEQYMIYKRKEVKYEPKGEFGGSWEDFKNFIKGIREFDVEPIREAFKESGTMKRTRPAELFFKDLSRMSKEEGIKRAKLEELKSKKIELEGRKGFFGTGLEKVEKEELKRLEKVTGELTDELTDLTEEIARTKDRLRESVLEAAVELFEVGREREYKIARSIEKYTSELKTGKGLFRGQAPLPAIDVDFGPRNIEDLSPGEFTKMRARKLGTEDAFKEYEEAMAKQAELVERVREAQRKVTEGEIDEDTRKVEVWSDALKRNQDQLDDNINKVNNLTEELKKQSDASKSLQDAYIYTLDSLKQLNRFNIEGEFGETALWDKRLKGFPGAPTLGPDWKEMTASQRLFATGSKEMQEGMRSFAFYQKTTGTRTDYLAGLEERKKAVEREMEPLKEKGGVLLPARNVFFQENAREIKELQDTYKNLNNQIEAQKNVMNSAASEWADYGRRLKKALAFEEIIKGVEDARRRIMVEERVARMPEMVEAERDRAMLLGGGHPRAQVMVTPEEERMGRAARIDLQPFEDPMKVERARLIFRQAGAEGEEYLRIEQALRDLGTLYERREAVWEQQRENKLIVQQGQQFENMVRTLDDFLTTPSITEEEKTAVLPALQEIRSLMTDFYKGRTVEQMRAVVTAAGVEPGTVDYKMAMEAINKVADTGKVYRGALPFEERSIKEKYMVAKELIAPETLTDQENMFKGIVTDPIIVRQDIQTELLKLIARESGTSASAIKALLEKTSKQSEAHKKAVGTTTGDETPWYSFAEKAERGWNSGGPGPVSGPGGPREDKVPAWLSPGEYVIRQAAARRLGYGNLEYMNQEGKIPGLQDGGGIASHFGKSALQVAGVPGRLAIDMAKPIGHWIDKLFESSTEKDLESLRERLTFVKELPILNTDTLLKLAMPAISKFKKLRSVEKKQNVVEPLELTDMQEHVASVIRHEGMSRISEDWAPDFANYYESMKSIIPDFQKGGKVSPSLKAFLETQRDVSEEELLAEIGGLEEPFIEPGMLLGPASLLKGVGKRLLTKGISKGIRALKGFPLRTLTSQVGAAGKDITEDLPSLLAKKVGGVKYDGPYPGTPYHSFTEATTGSTFTLKADDLVAEKISKVVAGIRQKFTKVGKSTIGTEGETGVLREVEPGIFKKHIPTIFEKMVGKKTIEQLQSEFADLGRGATIGSFKKTPKFYDGGVARSWGGGSQNKSYIRELQNFIQQTILPEAESYGIDMPSIDFGKISLPKEVEGAKRAIRNALEFIKEKPYVSKDYGTLEIAKPMSKADRLGEHIWADISKGRAIARDKSTIRLSKRILSNEDLIDRISKHEETHLEMLALEAQEAFYNYLLNTGQMVQNSKLDSFFETHNKFLKDSAKLRDESISIGEYTTTTPGKERIAPSKYAQEPGEFVPEIASEQFRRDVLSKGGELYKKYERSVDMVKGELTDLSDEPEYGEFIKGYRQEKLDKLAIGEVSAPK